MTLLTSIDGISGVTLGLRAEARGIKPNITIKKQERGLHSPASCFRIAALSVLSQVNSASSLPKCP